MTTAKDMFIHPGPQPNGLQASEDGLWVIDQVDNHIYKLDWEKGYVLERIPAEVAHSSGITLGGENIWISSTFDVESAGDDGSPKIVKCNSDGSTVGRFDTPGIGFVSYPNRPPADRITGAHGLEWVDEENLWVAVPPSQTIYLMDPETMAVKRSIPSPGSRPHGLFVKGDHMWLADTSLCKIHKMDTSDGTVVEEIDIPSPEVHGMTLFEDTIWFACAMTRRICTVSL